ncbi:MAG: SCO family protein [Cloacibacterium normanense]|nr:SCO family protein [Cloacibacterium normanense]
MNKMLVYQMIALVAIVLAFIAGNYFFKKSLHTVMKAPNFELIDQNNRRISNTDMLGKVYVVEFFYARCPTICPIMNNNLKFVDKAINSKDFGIISISIDPENDTPEFLKAHAKKLGVTNPNWHFLTGNRDYIGDLANEFDIYVGDKDDQSESLNHSGMLALVDKEGNVRCRFGKDGMPILYYSGLNYDDEEGKNASLKGKFQPDRKLLIEDIQKLLEE